MKRGVLALSIALLAGVLPSGIVAAVTPHQATLPGVTLLPPVATGPRPTAAIDPDVNLRMEIFALVADQAVGNPVGPSFARAGAGGAQPIRLHGPSDVRTDHYHANWGTRQSKLPNGATVRVEVRLPSAAAGPACNAGVDLDTGCIAYFDVQLRKAKKGIAPAGMLGVQNGRTLPIRVHIADGALDPPPPPDDGDEPITELMGEPDSPAAAAIPDMDFEFDEDDYAPNTDFGGMVLSFRTLFLAFKLDVTVAEANALLAEIGAEIIGGRPGVAGEAEGFLLVRVPTTSHADMAALIDRLRLDARVELAVQDSILEPVEVSDFVIEGPGGWLWDVTPTGGNWGLEQIRAPQLWNLNRQLVKEGGPANIGVLDGGFFYHNDIVYDVDMVTARGQEPEHGTHVAGTIAATYDNKYGIDGVNPFVNLVVRQYSGGVAWGLFGFVEDAEDLDIVNLSLGYNWYKWTPARNPEETPELQELVINQAELFELWQTAMTKLGRKLPLLVAAAGNDSESFVLGNDDIDAKWASPWNYAALVNGADNVIVVEAVGREPTGGTSRAPFSNLNGHVSAPGVEILSLGPPDMPYYFDSGTSMATPHVAGIAGYLHSLDPTLTPSEIRELLRSTAIPGGDFASPRVDAFGAALAIDTLRGYPTVLRRLLDIDDGSDDGNLRLDCSSECYEFTTENFDADNGIGDGNIDMSDFRRWRDWHLIAMGYEGTAFDGRSSHPKNDVNGDGFPGAAEDENVFPYGDFNGDGTLDLTSTRFVPGYVSAVATDLEVLQSLFDDPDYSASQLPRLVESADIHIDGSRCVGPGDIGYVVKITDPESGVWLWGDFENDANWHEYTVPVQTGGYNVRVEALDANGDVSGVAQTTVDAALGSDSWYAPAVCGRINLTPGWPGLRIELNKNDSTTEMAHLTSTGLEAIWEFGNTLEHVETSVTGGTIEGGDDVAIEVKITCPDRTGPFGGYLNLVFKDGAGGIIRGRGVPENLPVDIRCLEGGVTVSPSPLVIKASPGASASGTVTLTNKGTALNYTATPDEHLSIAGSAAEGEVPKQSATDITITGQCPTQQGRYPSYVTMEFEKPDGQSVTDNVPTQLLVELVCERVADPFRFIEQLSTTEVDLARPNQHLLVRFHSIPGNETGTSYVEKDHVPIENEEFEWNGFGTRFAHINNVSGSQDLCSGCSDPLTRTRSAQSKLNWETTIGAPHVTISGDFSQAYTQTRLVSGNSDRVAVSMSFDFLLLETADLDGTWTCTGTCSISLVAEDGTSIIASSATGTFDDPLEPGRYVLVVQNRLPMDGTALSITAAATYSFQLTFVELEEET